VSGQRSDGAPGAENASVFEALARLGEFFRLDSFRPQTPPAPPWQPLSELAGAPRFAGRVDQIRTALAAMTSVPSESIELRVAASVAHLGLSARLISPLLGIAVLAGRIPDITLADLYWQPAPGGAFPLAIAGPAFDRSRPAGGGPDRLDAQFADWLAGGPVSVLTARAAELAVPSQTLWGNVASALSAAQGVIARAQPALAAPAAAFVDAVLKRSPLAGRHTTTVDGRFRRTNCCLIYQVSGDRTAICGDCVLLGRRGLALEENEQPRE
jgi:FhuF 2Fe-2S C-terminal domain